MRIVSTRFGTIEIDPNEVIEFPQGMIGFPNETRYVLLLNGENSAIGWLQSTGNGSLAFPVVSSEALTVDYSRMNLAVHEEDADGEPDYAVMVVMTATGGGRAPTVNLLAPIVVNAKTRTGAQVIVDHPSYSTSDPLSLRSSSAKHENGHAAPMQTRIVESSVAGAR